MERTLPSPRLIPSRRLNTFSKAIQLNISIGSNITPAERAVLLAQQKRMDDEVRLASPANTVCAVRVAKTWKKKKKFFFFFMNVLLGLQRGST